MPHRRSPGSRAYDELRTAILGGELPAGHIDIQKTADRFGVSPTPVREALARLASEQLVNFSPGQGYAVAATSAKALCDLYVWTDRVIRLALDLTQELGASGPVTPAAKKSRGLAIPPALRYAHAVASLFEEIAAAPSNAEFIGKLADSNARLFRARSVEWSILDKAPKELSGLFLLWRTGHLGELGGAIETFHVRRIGRCEEIAQALSQPAS